MENKGFLIVALGSPLYGNYAFNLALSIKYADSSAKIALVYTDSAIADLSEKDRQMAFDIEIVAKDEWYHDSEGHLDYMLSKLWLDEATPFEETIYVDADSICVCDISSLSSLTIFHDELVSGYEKLFAHMGYYGEFIAQCYENSNMKNNKLDGGYTTWVAPKEIRHFYGLHDDEILPVLSTTILYWKKGETSTQIFQTARDLYFAPHKPLKHRLGGNLPDEFFFDVACAKLKYHMPVNSWVHWHFIHGRMGSSVEDRMRRISRDFWFLTVGGADIPEYMNENYNWHIHKVATHFKVGRVLHCYDKGDFVVGRGAHVKHERINHLFRQRYDKIYVINLAHRKDRLENTTELLNELGVDNWERFEAIAPKSGNASMSAGQLGCMLSHQAIIREAKEKRYTEILILEDDVTLRMGKYKDGLTIGEYELLDYLSRVPKDSEIVLFGGFHQLTPSSTGLPGVFRAWKTYSTHMMAVKFTAYDTILGLEPTGPYDVLLAEHYGRMRVYCPPPSHSIAGQREGHSDVLGYHVDYSKILKEIK